MHKLDSKPITIDCFEIDDLATELKWNSKYYTGEYEEKYFSDTVSNILLALEGMRLKYKETGDKRYWKELVRWLPCGWLQTRTVTMNYENLLSVCHQREHHKLTEWSGVDPFGTPSFIKFAKSLPYANDFIFPST